MPVCRAARDLTFTLEVHMSDEEGISRTTLEITIKERVRQARTRVE